MFRAVYKRDRRGNLLDKDDKVVPHDDPEKFGKAVHLKDIHLEKGMQCSDCHFGQDNHGSGKLYGETRNAVEIDCVDCHGSVSKRATLITTGPAAPEGGTALAALRTRSAPGFRGEGDALQRSMWTESKWEGVRRRHGTTARRTNERSASETVKKADHGAGNDT